MTNRLSRRRLVAGTGLTLAALALPRRATAQNGAPAPVGGEIAPDGFRVLRARPAGYDGRVPGPLLRIRRGTELKVRLVNELSEPTAIHWHGVRLPNAMDLASVAPGQSFDYRFAAPDAGTFWYHAPGSAQDRLHGVLLVDETEPVAVDRDVVLVLGDARPPQDIAVRPNERLRLRLVNSTTAAITVRVDRHAPRVMAIDGQPAEPFLARGGAIRLGPGNRIDLFVDMALPPGTRAPVEIANGQSGFTPLLHLIYDDSSARPASLAEPAPLPSNGLPERIDFRGALKRDLPLPIAAPADRTPLFRVARNRAVMLALRNGSPVAQSVHVHGHAFRLLDRMDDGWKPFWLDTLLVAPGETERIAFVADNPGSWRLACAALGGPERAETWFAVS
jgi:FtsP/CotA-like multicopper oxidase with cupredoxin domain